MYWSHWHSLCKNVLELSELSLKKCILCLFFLYFLPSKSIDDFPFFLSFFPAAILDDPMECSRGERLAITLAKDNINRSSNRSTTGKLEVDIFELLRDSEYEMGETSK